MRCPAVFLLFATLSLAACETTVDIALPEHEPQLVVSSLFAADSLWAVGVGTSQSVLSSGSPTPVGSDATVEILEDGAVVETLERRTSGPDGFSLYRSRRHRPQAGRSYTLRATASRFEAAEATAILPTPVPLATKVRQVEVPETYGEARSYEITVSIPDPGGEANYYGLATYQFYYGGVGGANGEVILRREVGFAGYTSADPLLRENRPEEDFLEPEADIYYTLAYFTDETFDGQTYTLRLRTTVSGDTVSTGPYAVALQSLSKDVYEHLRTRELADFAGDNPFAEPVAVYTNIAGGLGIFGGYSTSMVVFQEGGPLTPPLP